MAQLDFDNVKYRMKPDLPNKLAAGMLDPVEKIVCFMETRDISRLADVFARADVGLLDSFAPYFFTGTDAAQNWATRFLEHASAIRDLRHSFGAASEFSQKNGHAFFSQTIIWQGLIEGGAFHETGALAIHLVEEDAAWRVKNFGWAVTDFRFV